MGISGLIFLATGASAFALASFISDSFVSKMLTAFGYVMSFIAFVCLIIALAVRIFGYS